MNELTAAAKQAATDATEWTLRGPDAGPHLHVPRSDYELIVWPTLPPAPGAMQLAIQFQLEQTQWWEPERLLAHQMRQLQRLVNFSYRNVTYYRDRLGPYINQNLDAMTYDRWLQVPLLTRGDIQEAGETLFTLFMPPKHGRMIDVTTSGSTGSPVKVKGDKVTGLFFHAFNLRNHLWHRRDLTGKMSSIRFMRSGGAEPPHGSHSDRWAPGFVTGPSSALNVFSSLDQQIDWLQREQPQYLLTYPSNIEHLARLLEERGERIESLRDVGTFGESVTPEQRELVRRVLGVPVIDMYSSMEMGMIAIQCPHHDHYHIQSENVLMEILNDDNEPCAPGEVGRVVVTPLNNFVSPLIRYDIGDRAEPGEPCDCGRGLPVVNRIYGRVRNMLVMPNGERRWPGVFISQLSDIVPLRQMQFVQRAPTDIDARLVARREVTPQDEEALRKRIHDMLGAEFNINFEYVDQIERSPGGKYEDFRSEVA